MSHYNHFLNEEDVQDLLHEHDFDGLDLFLSGHDPTYVTTSYQNAHSQTNIFRASGGGIVTREQSIVEDDWETASVDSISTREDVLQLHGAHDVLLRQARADTKRLAGQKGPQIDDYAHQTSWHQPQQFMSSVGIDVDALVRNSSDDVISDPSIDFGLPRDLSPTNSNLNEDNLGDDAGDGAIIGLPAADDLEQFSYIWRRDQRDALSRPNNHNDESTSVNVRGIHHRGGFKRFDPGDSDAEHWPSHLDTHIEEALALTQPAQFRTSTLPAATNLTSSTSSGRRFFDIEGNYQQNHCVNLGHSLSPFHSLRRRNDGFLRHETDPVSSTVQLSASSNSGSRGLTQISHQESTTGIPSESHISSFDLMANDQISRKSGRGVGKTIVLTPSTLNLPEIPRPNEKSSICNAATQPSCNTGVSDDVTVDDDNETDAGEKRVRKEHPSSNTATQKKRRGLTTSQFNGVCWNKRKEKWRARFANKGKREFLGDFDTEIEAARAFDERTKQVMSPAESLSRLNFK